MKTPLRFLIALTVVLCPSLAAAQAPGAPAGARPMPGAPGAMAAAAAQAPGAVVGKLVNEAGAPVANGSIAVRSARDSALVNGALARPDGSFRVEGLAPGRYTVRVRALGFAPVVKAGIVVTAESPRVDLGTLALTAVAAQLSGVEVTAEREEAALAPDRNTYTVKDMPAASSGNAVEVLRTVPGVEVDGDNKVSLRGNQNVVVQINGRATPMRGEQLGNFLAQLPANMVAKVEVVPNPSAKDDPEGMAGIVNLVLKQNTDLGTSGGFTLGSGSTGQVNANGNLGHQKGPLTLFGSYGFFRDTRQMTGYNNRAYLDTEGFLKSDSRGEMHPLSHNITGNAEYKIGAKSSLTSNLLLSLRKHDRTNDSFYRSLDAVGGDTTRYSRLTSAGSRDNSFDYSLAFKRTLQPQRNELSTEARVNRSTTRFQNRFTDLSLASDGTRAETGRERNDLDETRQEANVQVDLTRPLGARGKVETGYKGTLRQLDNEFGVDNLASGGDWVRDLARSNAFTYNDQIHAVYGVVSQSFGKLSLQGGLRLEQALSTFDLATTRQSYDNDYRSVYPSGIVSYNVTDKQQVKASYSKRVNRPDTRQLNPFEFREDALNVFRGNPYLKPEYTHAMELGFQQSFAKGSLQLTPFFRRTVDAVRVIRTVDPTTRVQTQTFQNVATSDSYGGDANGSLRIGKLNAFGGFSAFRQVTDASNLSTDVSNNGFGWSARANGTYKLTPSLDAQTFFMYRAPMTTEMGRISAMSMMNLALRQKLRGDKASATLRVQDPFNSMRFGFQGTDSRIFTESLRRFGARGVFLSVNYNFGQAPKLRPRPQEQQPDNVGQPGMGPG